MSVVAFPEQSSLLCVVSVHRRGDGSTKCVIEDMPALVIERTGVDVSTRLDEIANWLDQAAADVREQAGKYR